MSGLSDGLSPVCGINCRNEWHAGRCDAEDRFQNQLGKRSDRRRLVVVLREPVLKGELPDRRTETVLTARSEDMRWENPVLDKLQTLMSGG